MSEYRKAKIGLLLGRYGQKCAIMAMTGSSQEEVHELLVEYTDAIEKIYKENPINTK